MSDESQLSVRAPQRITPQATATSSPSRTPDNESGPVDNTEGDLVSERLLVDTVSVRPDDNGRKSNFWGSVYLELWSDGTVTWDHQR